MCIKIMFHGVRFYVYAVCCLYHLEYIVSIYTKKLKEIIDKWCGNFICDFLLYYCKWYERCRVRRMACISGIYCGTGYVSFFKLFPFKIYPCCTNFKLAESRREDCELCISTSSNRIPDNVLTVQLLVYCYKRVRKNTE